MSLSSHYFSEVTTFSVIRFRIGRYPDGRLNGELVDTAKSFIELPPRPQTDRPDTLAAELRRLTEVGLTSIRYGSANQELFELNEMIVARKHSEAFEEFYADDCEMQENSDPPTRGKDANREREKQFFAMLNEFHSIELKASAVSEDVSFSEWRNEMTIKGIGRVTTEQTSVRRWKNGQVVHERFYYKPGS